VEEGVAEKIKITLYNTKKMQQQIRNTSERDWLLEEQLLTQINQKNQEVDKAAVLSMLF